jgi:hypothetical protein
MTFADWAVKTKAVDTIMAFLANGKVGIQETVLQSPTI